MDIFRKGHAKIYSSYIPHSCLYSVLLIKPWKTYQWEYTQVQKYTSSSSASKTMAVSIVNKTPILLAFNVGNKASPLQSSSVQSLNLNRWLPIPYRFVSIWLLANYSIVNIHNVTYRYTHTSVFYARKECTIARLMKRNEPIDIVDRCRWLYFRISRDDSR